MQREHWKAHHDWEGETAFIVAGGPSVSTQDLSRLKGRKVIAVNTAYQIVPFAQYLYAMDTRWLRTHEKDLKNFAGQIITVSTVFRIRGLLRMRKIAPPGLTKERNAVSGRRTGVQGAINLAVHFGATRIVLVGVDCQIAEDGKSHWHKPHKWPQKPDCFDEQYKDLESTVKPLKKLGIEIINASPRSRLDFWPNQELEKILTSAVNSGDRPMKNSIWIGYDPREANAFALARYSTKKRLTQEIPIKGLVLSDLRKRGIYTRAHEQRGLQMWDMVSDAPMSTQFSNSRFLVPHLAVSGWALFYDCDMLIQTNLCRFFEEICDEKYAVMCVKHDHVPDNSIKMDSQMQTRYARKNWSSVMVFNCDHPANDWLTPDNVNKTPGRDLHRFCWLDDSEIGELGPEWNYLVGHTTLPPGVKPCIIHHTDGIPSMAGYEDSEYAAEWKAELDQWAL